MATIWAIARHTSGLVLGETASPRNTRTAWLSRRISSSSSLPMCAPTLILETVVILSTIKRDAARKPLRSFGSTRRRNNGASVSSVVKAQMVIEAVAPKLSSWTMTTGRGCPHSPYRQQRSRCRLASFIAPIRYRIDERLILPCVGAGGDGGRLAMRFGAEGRGAYIGHPNLDRTEPLLAQALAMFPHPDARGIGARCRGHDKSPIWLHVTNHGSPAFARTFTGVPG